jgi:hypothetical protein
MTTIIQNISIDDILIHGKDKYNSNNHWTIEPDDYVHVLSQSRTMMWVDLFRDSYIVINIDPNELKWMKQAAKIGCHTGTISHLYDDDLDMLLLKNKQFDTIFNGTPYFIRAENVSLKSGMHGVGPYTNLKQIIQSMVSCIQGHTPISDKTTQIKLYLFPWIAIDCDKEFRIFVYNGTITAISQQNLYQVNRLLKQSNNRDNVIREWIHILCKYFDNVISKKITHIKNYTIDIALIGENNDPYFIEINSFGKLYAAGSALFHWIHDDHILCGNEHIFFRYVSE